MLEFPCGTSLVSAEAREVGPGITWMRRSLPWAVTHINVWALADGEGWTIVDTGLETAESTAAWEFALAMTLGGRPVTRVICTHMHRDHTGMAGWLVSRFFCGLWMTQLEYLSCRMAIAEGGRNSSAGTVAFQRAAGWSDDAIHHHRGHEGRFGEGVHPLPTAYRRIHEGEVLRIGGRDWHALVGRGHSPEHLCLHSPALRLLISGDQVLPEITTNVSVLPMEPDADPLADWTESLGRIRNAVPDDVLVLPAHGAPFRSLHARLDKLLAGHEDGLARVHAELARPRRAVDVFPVLFRRTVGIPLFALATGESLAHLNHLMGRGLARRETDTAGVNWYRAT